MIDTIIHHILTNCTNDAYIIIHLYTYLLCIGESSPNTPHSVSHTPNPNGIGGMSPGPGMLGAMGGFKASAGGE
jgi:hypothetical protein